MRYAGMGRNEIDKRILVGIPKERDQWEDVGVDGMIILKCIFKK
jgi:hypothetical protein